MESIPNGLTLSKLLSYSFKDKGFYSILGESGSGKSTLLNILGLIETPSEGKIYFKSERIDDLNDSKRREFLLPEKIMVFLLLIMIIGAMLLQFGHILVKIKNFF